MIICFYGKMTRQVLINASFSHRQYIDHGFSFSVFYFPSLALIIRALPSSGKVEMYQGAEGRGEQRPGLCTKALMRDLGTILECRDRVFVRTGRTLWKQVNNCPSGFEPATLISIAHDFPTAPSPHHKKIVDRCLYYYYH